MTLFFSEFHDQILKGNFEKVRIKLQLLDKILFYSTNNCYIGFKRYMEESYISVTSHIYNAWIPSFALRHGGEQPAAARRRALRRAARRAGAPHLRAPGGVAPRREGGMDNRAELRLF